MRKTFIFLMVLSVAIEPILTQHKCQKDFSKTTFLRGHDDINVLLIWFPINAGTKTSLQVCSRETGLPVFRHCDYDRSYNTGKWETFDTNQKLINCSSISRLCPEEPFQHNYIMKNNVTKTFTNKWKTTVMMERGDLQEPCLQESGLPLTRKCEYNPVHHMAQWELLTPDMRSVSCLWETREVIVTHNLNSLYQEVKMDKLEDKVQPVKVVQQMTELLTSSQAVRIPADIRVSSEILKVITHNNANPDLVTGVLNVTDIIMASDPCVVIKSEEINATTTFLQTIDNYLQNMAKVLVPTSHCQNTANGVVKKIFKRTSIFYINPSCSNISGVAIYSTSARHRRRHHQHFDQHTGHFYSFIYLNQTLEQILNEPDLRLATYFPLSLWNKLKNEIAAVDDQTVLTFIIFENDLLFVNRTEISQKPTRNIIEISIPNYTGELPDDVPFVLSYHSGRRRGYKRPDCGYWNYTAWVTTGIKTEYKNISNNQLIICHSTHLTHFAAIFGVSFVSRFSLGDTAMLSIPHDLILDYISILGCGLSLIGLSCIWITAVCFRSFRVASSNKVLLNMCFVLSLLMLYFLLMNLPQLWQFYTDTSNSLHCQVMGAFLHYIVTVLFFWMLIISIMQYQRYVKVLGYERPSNYIIKYALAAWGLPLIPVCLVFYMKPNTYLPSPEQVQQHTAICFPSGEYLTYGVILPTALIMFVNLFIFVYIFWSLRCTRNRFEHNRDRSNIQKEIRIMIFLFFLLGISWIFGLLSRLEGTQIFSYLFCLTSTLQGFVLFLYSIIIDRSARMSWTILCCAKNYDTMENRNLAMSPSWK